jgi:hypothetical protein
MKVLGCEHLNRSQAKFRKECASSLGRVIE